MNGYYPPCNVKRNKSYNYLYDTYTNDDDWISSNHCHCIECFNSNYYSPNTHSECSLLNCCSCPNCPNKHAEQHTQNQYITEYEEYPSEAGNYYEHETHCPCGGYHFSLNNQSCPHTYGVRDNFPVFGVPCNIPCRCEEESNNIYKDHFWSPHIPAYNFNSIVPCEIEDTNERSYCYQGTLNLDARSKPSIKKSTSTKDSFYTCLPYASNNIEMVYKNSNNIISKSSLNQTSLESLNKKPSKTILKKRQNKAKINSGYFEVVSPTHTRHIHKNASENKTKKVSKSVSAHFNRTLLHYGYFEVKEKNYATSNEKTLKKLPSLELDKVPTKISKQIDTAHLKKSIMVDKSLSAHLNQSRVKTSDKSLTVDIDIKDKRGVTKSDVLQILKTLSKFRRPHIKFSNKMTQFNFSKSHVNVNYSKSSPSINKVQIVKSSSEGNIRKISSSTIKLQKSKEKVAHEIKIENVHEIENRMYNQDKENCSINKEISKKKSVVTIYKSTNEICSSNQMPLELNRNKSNTKHYSKIETLEDIADSEEVEIDSSDFENRSPLSSYSNIARDSEAFGNPQSLENNKDSTRSIAKSSEYSETTSTKRLYRKLNSSKQDSKYEVSHDSIKSSKRSSISKHNKVEKQINSNSVSHTLNKNNNSLALYRYSQHKETSVLDSQIKLKSSFASKSCSTKNIGRTSSMSKDNENKSLCCQDKSIRFNNNDLGVIREESEAQVSNASLKLIHQTSDSSNHGISNLGWRHSSNCSNNKICLSDIEKRDLQMQSKYSHERNSSRMAPRKSAGSNTRTHQSKVEELQARQIESDEAVHQNCYDCPRRRYYSQFESVNLHGSGADFQSQSYNKPCKYELDMSLHNCRQNTSRRVHNQIKLSNIISFIVFIIVFCSIFEYISVYVLTGK